MTIKITSHINNTCINVNLKEYDLRCYKLQYLMISG